MPPYHMHAFTHHPTKDSAEYVFGWEDSRFTFLPCEIIIRLVLYKSERLNIATRRIIMSLPGKAGESCFQFRHGPWPVDKGTLFSSFSHAYTTYQYVCCCPFFDTLTGSIWSELSWTACLSAHPSIHTHRWIHISHDMLNTRIRSMNVNSRQSRPGKSSSLSC